MRKQILLAAVLAILAMPILSASSTSLLPSGQNLFDCTTLFSNSVNGANLVSPQINTYSSYSGLLSISLIIVLMMFVLMGLIFVLGIAFKWDTLKNFAKTEYLEGFVSILIILLIMGGVAAFNGTMNFMGNLFAVGTGTTAPTTFQTLYSSLCSNIFQKMILPGFLTYIWIDINKLMINLISSLTITIQPGGFGIAIQPFYGFSMINQLLWLEGPSSIFMLVGGAMIIVLLFVIYYLFPLFLFLGVALRTFPWTRAAGGAFIALFIAFYIFFPVIMYPFTVSYSQYNSPSSSALGICNVGNTQCPSGIGVFLGSFSAYLGVLDLDVGYTAYTNLVYFSQILLYFATNVFGLVISLLISYEILGIFGSLLGSRSVKGDSIFKKILSPKK